MITSYYLKCSFPNLRVSIRFGFRIIKKMYEAKRIKGGKFLPNHDEKPMSAYIDICTTSVKYFTTGC